MRSSGAKITPNMVFALMSGKKKKDYREVIREIIKNIPGQPSVKKVTVNFERAIWSAFQKVLPEVRIMGCAFSLESSPMEEGECPQGSVI